MHGKKDKEKKCHKILGVMWNINVENKLFIVGFAPYLNLKLFSCEK